MSAAGGIPASSSGGPIHAPGDSEAGHDRRPSAPNPPRELERWRHVRTGIVATVIYVREDYLYVDESATAWPLDLFLARWERT